jgi:hypothetical protein
VGKVVCRVISHDWTPFIVEAAFQLNHETQYQASLQFKPDPCGVFVIKEAMELNDSH